MGATIRAIKVEVRDDIAGLPERVDKGRYYYVDINTFRLKEGIPYGDVYTDCGYVGYMSLTCFNSASKERSNANGHDNV